MCGKIATHQAPLYQTLPSTAFCIHRHPKVVGQLLLMKQITQLCCKYISFWSNVKTTKSVYMNIVMGVVLTSYLISIACFANYNACFILPKLVTTELPALVSSWTNTLWCQHCMIAFSCVHKAADTTLGYLYEWQNGHQMPIDHIAFAWSWRLYILL